MPIGLRFSTNKIDRDKNSLCQKVSPRAGQKALASRLWPTGLTLPALALVFSFYSLVLVAPRGISINEMGFRFIVKLGYNELD